MARRFATAIIRASPAMSLADSILQTASIARCVSDPVTRSIGAFRRATGNQAFARRLRAWLPDGWLVVQLPDLDLDPADDLLGLGERSVGHGALATGVPNPRTLRAVQRSVGREQHARLGHLADQLAHAGVYLGARVV